MSNISIETVLPHVKLIRGIKVMVDSDLASLYEVETKHLNQSVKRNVNRFPDDFMFQITKEEFEILKSQSATSSWGGRRTPPYVFTEQGVAMLSSVLNSKKAIEVNISIMRAFIKIRALISDSQEAKEMIDSMRKQYDGKFEKIIKVINQMTAIKNKTNPIGFIWDKENS